MCYNETARGAPMKKPFSYLLFFSIAFWSLSFPFYQLHAELQQSAQEENESEEFLARELEFRKIERWIRWRSLHLDSWNIDNIRPEIITSLEEDVKKQRQRIGSLLRFKIILPEQAQSLKEQVTQKLEKKISYLYFLYHQQVVRDNRIEMKRLNKEMERYRQESQAIREAASLLRPKERNDEYEKAKELLKEVDTMQEKHDSLKEENKKIKRIYQGSFAPVDQELIDSSFFKENYSVP